MQLLEYGRKPIEFLKRLAQFIRAVAEDERIPPIDKKVLLGLLALLISPLDIIPDWIPVFGQLDDVVIGALILDYLFNVLDEDILLNHYPWGPKSFTAVKRAARIFATLTPGAVKKRLWSYQGPSGDHRA